MRIARHSQPRPQTEPEAAPLRAHWLPRRLFARLLRFSRANRGSTAVEFAIVGPVFLGSLFAILETGTLFLRSTAIEAGVEEAKRLTMTGQLAASGNTTAQQEAFRRIFCSQVDWIIDCSAVKFDVRAFKKFGDAAVPSPIVNGKFESGALNFNPGGPCEIVVIRAYYEAASLTSFIRSDVSNLSNGNVLIGGSAAFKNEPFGACS